MPLYEYICDDCHRENELLVRGDEQPVCEKCGSNKLTKLLSVPSAHSSSGSPVGGVAPCGMPGGT